MIYICDIYDAAIQIKLQPTNWLVFMILTRQRYIANQVRADSVQQPYLLL